MMNGQITLLELNLRIRNAIQDSFPETIWVVAEISELKENRTGHCYLELVEKDELSDEIKARARATIWSYTWRMLKPYFETTTGQAFTQGIKVLVQVSVEFHPSYGMSLNIKDIDPTYTLGDMTRRRREIIEKLTKAGVIGMNKELPLPLVPQRIAVISSATAAGYGDFINHLDNNSYGFLFHHELFEAWMQGGEAVPSILSALNRIFAREEEFDAVAIIRGGGATADLSCFDHFDLAFTVAQFPLPVITGIGHEKDDTIADMVAHTRMKTPTAVAEFFISGVLRFRDRLHELQVEISDLARHMVSEQQEYLTRQARDISGAVEVYIDRAEGKLQMTGQRVRQRVMVFTFRRKELLQNIQHKLIQRLSAARVVNQNQLRHLDYRLRIASVIPAGKAGMALQRMAFAFRKSLQGRLAGMESKLSMQEEKLRILDPENVLKRGFTITTQQGRIMKSVLKLIGSEHLETHFHDGKVTSKILKTDTYGNHQKVELPGCPD